MDYEVHTSQALAVQKLADESNSLEMLPSTNPATAAVMNAPCATCTKSTKTIRSSALQSEVL
jgi:hypothetical protein